MRTVLVDWLIKAHMQYKLEQETLYLSIDIIDRFLSKEIVPLVELKLLGFTALFLACKYEEGTPLKVGSNIWTAWRKDYLQLSDRTFTPQQVYDLEEKILRKLGWNLAVITTPYHFIHHYLEASTKSDAKMKNMVCFLMELALIHYETIKYSPSTIAASAVYVALCSLHQKPNWSKKLKLYTGYSMEQLRDCIWLVEKLHKMPWKDMPKAIHGKYSVPARDRVSLLPPAGSGYQHFHFKWDLRRRKL
ncbi:unnamed protein product [Dovyalis caffra]|uniref:B-like cyclin n=1 Tax=Dovyalis caffra TaxID=77055 RepID=A0AAV1SDI7_9ROSI|nr:unnamed protein product [Dovyalis caffra]